jgi:murein L,D-transpeptidase YcbB/YkuD
LILPVAKSSPARKSSTLAPESHLFDRDEPEIGTRSTWIRHCGLSSAAARFVFLLLLCWPAFGCHSLTGASLGNGNNTVDAGAVADRLRTITSAETLPELHRANYADCRKNVQAAYEAIHYAPAWVRDGQPTPQALAVISALEDSQKKGLNPEDYDASQWPARLAALKSGSGNADTVAQFDAALTIGAMRYLSNLRIGRLSPKPLAFDIDLDQKHYDLPQFLVQKVLTASNVPEVLSEAEPQYLGYQRTETALQTFLNLAAQDHSDALPIPQRTMKSGDPYIGAAKLDQRLRLLGDLPQSPASIPNAHTFNASLVEGVKHFQTRHGLNSDGKLDKETLRQLNMPLSVRVIQLEDSLERWRWLPSDYPRLPVAVNIPGFRLRVFSDDHTIALRMNVVVGEAFKHQTPVFAKEMKYIIFRPYWNLPLDIVRAEIVPKLRKSPSYLARKGFEATDQDGRVVSGRTVSAATLAQIQSGKLLVRQKPGPSNALGLVKFMFPNEFDVYLHSTPTPQLFNRSRRDFSHGCIRVEKPAELAAWLLQDQSKWTLEKIKAAMQSGPDNQQVNLTKQVPVVIVYLTAIVEENGEVYFYDDIYGDDASLNDALAKGQPYR